MMELTIHFPSCSRFFMGTTERSVFEVCPDDPSVTLIRKEVWIESDFLGLRRHTIQQWQKIKIEGMFKTCTRQG